MVFRSSRLLCASIALWAFACAGSTVPTATTREAGRAVVVWVSVDGLRHDYIEAFHPPFMSRLAREGAFTTQLAPIFPSLTFPSHTAEATGTTVDHDGIPSNTFYDETTGSEYKMSDASTLLQSEPIWITAARQHIRVAVGDWPFSYQEAGPIRADYSEEKFNNDTTDEQRMQHLSDVWRADSGDATRQSTRPSTQPVRDPLRLIIGYVADVDHAGHKYGPGAAETGKQLLETDDILARFQQRCIEQFNATMRPGDELYFIITTDHGMSPISYQANVERLLGPVYRPELRIITSGSLANIYLDRVPAGERDAVASALVAKLKGYDFLNVWKRSDLPASFGYAHPTRTGEVILNLKRGYSWTSQRLAATRPATSGQLGTHGYDVNEDPDMYGFAVIWRYRHPLGGKDLGRIDSLRLHPTVAKILQIDPAPNATKAPIDLGPG